MSTVASGLTRESKKKKVTNRENKNGAERHGRITGAQQTSSKAQLPCRRVRPTETPSNFLRALSIRSPRACQAIFSKDLQGGHFAPVTHYSLANPASAISRESIRLSHTCVAWSGQ